MKRKEILEKVSQIICHDRNTQYGEPEQAHSDIATLWTSYIRAKYKIPLTISAVDVAQMMVLFKIARTFGGKKDDTYHDEVGYAAIAAELALNEEPDNDTVRCSNSG